MILGLGILVGGALYGRKILFLGLSLFLFFGLGFGANETNKHEPTPNTVDYYASVPEGVKIQGYVRDYPDVRNGHTLFVLESKRVETKQGWREVDGKVLITTRNYPEYNLGDWVEASCVLQIPGRLDDFDYRAYLAKSEIYTTCYYPKIAQIDAKNLSGLEGLQMSLMGNLNFLRENVLRGIGRVFPEPSGGFLSGILLGARNKVSEIVEDNFRTTGVSHMLAISGMHVAILLGFLYLFLRSFPRWVRFGIAVGFLACFTLLVGASASVMRAAIMGILSIFALTNFRQNNAVSALCFAGVFMLLFNPKLLIYDIGFQLSFLAVIGILVFYQTILQGLRKIAKVDYVWEMLALTLSAQIMTLPVVAWNFEQISLISPLTNVLVLPALPFVMLSGLLGGVLGIFSIFLGKIGGFVGWIFAEYLFVVTGNLAKIPYANVDFEIAEFWWIVGYYLILGGFIVHFKKYFFDKQSQNKGEASGKK